MMDHDLLVQLWSFSRCSPYSWWSVVGTACYLGSHGVSEDRVLGVIQTLAAFGAGQGYSLDRMAEFVVDSLREEAPVC